MSFLDKMKNFLVAPDEEQDLYEEEFEDEAEYTPEPVKTKYSPKVTVSESSRPAPLAQRATTFKIQVQDPLKYEDAPKIIDKLINNDAVVVNFENLEPEIKRQVFDFINGGIYAIEGKIQKVTRDIFILAPKGVGIEGIKEELIESGIYTW